MCLCEGENGGTVEGNSREEIARRLGPTMVWGIGIELGLEAYGAAAGVGGAVFADDAVEEVAGIYLHAGGRGAHLHGDGGQRALEPGAGALQRAVGVEDEVVVVAAAYEQLRVVGLDVASDGLGGAEVEGGALDGEEAAERDGDLVDGGVAVGVDLQEVVVDAAVEVAVEIEIAVIGEVDDGGAVGDGVVVDAEAVVVAEGVGDADLHRAGEAVVAVGACMGQHQFPVGVLHYVEEGILPARGAAVKAVGAVVLRQLAGEAVDGDASTGQAVGIAPDDGAEVALVVLRQVVLRAVEALHHVGAVESQPHDAAANGCDVGRQTRGVGQTVDGGLVYGGVHDGWN